MSHSILHYVFKRVTYPIHIYFLLTPLSSSPFTLLKTLSLSALFNSVSSYLLCPASPSWVHLISLLHILLVNIPSFISQFVEATLECSGSLTAQTPVFLPPSHILLFPTQSMTLAPCVLFKHLIPKTFNFLLSLTFLIHYLNHITMMVL